MIWNKLGDEFLGMFLDVFDEVNLGYKIYFKGSWVYFLVLGFGLYGYRKLVEE